MSFKVSSSTIHTSKIQLSQTTQSTQTHIKMAKEINARITHFVFEDIDKYEDVFKKASVGEFIELMTNNQLGWERHEVIMKDGEKQAKVVATIYDL